LPQVDIVLEGPGWLRSSRINDGVSKTFPLFAGHFVRQARALFCSEYRQLSKYRAVELCCTWGIPATY
jgi:hypothetical protein